MTNPPVSEIGTDAAPQRGPGALWKLRTRIFHGATMGDCGRCDQTIYEKGAVAGIITGGWAELIETIVQKVREETGEPVDWHYFAGRAVVKTTGNVEKVAFSLDCRTPRYHK